MMSTRIETVSVIVRHGDRNLRAVELWQGLIDVVNHKLGGVAVLGTIKHDFPNGAISGVILLAESHATIHSWPELRSSWYELSTCGDASDTDRFQAALTEFGTVEVVSRRSDTLR